MIYFVFVWSDGLDEKMTVAHDTTCHLVCQFSHMQIEEENYQIPMSLKDTIDSDFPEFIIECLKVHNDFRSRHGVPDLRLSKELCLFAQEWADICAKKGKMRARDNNPNGENIFSCMDKKSQLSSIEVVQKAVSSWYDEINKYNFGVEGVRKGTLHFSQLVWKSTADLGVGMATSKKGEVFVVANYQPPGNTVGQFVANVAKPVED